MNIDCNTVKMETEKRARQLRRNIVRMLTEAGSGHPGGSLSIIDILNVLYFETMHIDPAQPKMADRDRFVLSKGHAAGPPGYEKGSWRRHVNRIAGARPFSS